MFRSRTTWGLMAFARSASPASSARQRRRSRRLFVEALENRINLNAYLVNVAGDTAGTASGSGSGDSGDLRYCLNQAIEDQQTDTITFASSLAGETITLSSILETAPSGFANPYGQTSFIVGAPTISPSTAPAPRA